MAQTHRGPPPHETAEERREREEREKNETETEKVQRAAREESEARATAEAATAHLPRQGEPVRPPMSAADAAPGEKTVKMNFPAPVTLTLSGFRMVRFAAGVQEVPLSMVAEPYLQDCGVTKV